MTYYDIATGEPIEDYELEARYRDMLDEVYGDVNIGEYTYPAARALEAVDPIAYRCGLADYESAELGETIAERGYWVDVITGDGESHRAPEWFADESDALQYAADVAGVDLEDAPAGEYYVRVYDTSDSGIAEHRVIVH